mmetsp:Transcript_26387/g.38238  ORF Transcript_26387/g.38238 Transcript_26387/m.38238 type:complete len:210 (+) Transcript_26387:206-835(+)
MEKYRLVEERKAGEASGEASVVEEETVEGLTSSSSSSYEVRITQQGKPRNYISYAMNLFEQGSNKIILKAMGRAINKAVTIAEILKRKMPLHQITSLTSCEIVDVFEPLEEGLDVVESRRFVSCMIITLSRDGEGMDLKDIGYQPPLPSEEIQPGDLNVRRQTAAAITTSTDQKATSTPLPQKEIVEGKTGDVAEKDRGKTPEIEGKPP